MVHLRIADVLLDQIEGLDSTAFVVGNIAPDSGVPNSDWSAFTPPKSVSHYHGTKDGEKKKGIDIDAFCQAYFSPAHMEGYSRESYSFFLGYYIHLLTDMKWSEKITKPAKVLYAEEIAKDKKMEVAGPIFLPTKKLAITTRKSPCGVSAG